MLLNESCGDTTVSAHEAIANESLLPLCQELGENWEERFLSSLSSDSNGNNEGADSDDEEILEGSFCEVFRVLLFCFTTLTNKFCDNYGFF